MAIAKFLIILMAVIATINAEMFPSFSHDINDEDQRAPHKIILRSKRQQCVCVSVTFPNTVDEFDPSMSSFQCSCDPSASSSTSYYQTPIQRQYQQQQELQRELQQVQKSPNSQTTSCGCQLAPQYTSTAPPSTSWSAISFGTTQSPYDFFNTLQTSNNNNNYGNNENGNNNNNNIQPLFDCQCVTIPQQPQNDNSISSESQELNMHHQNYDPTSYNPTNYNLPQPQQPQRIQYPSQQYPPQQQQQQQQSRQSYQSQQPQYPQQQQLQYPQQIPQYLPTTTTTTTTTTPVPPSLLQTSSHNLQNLPRCKCVEIQILLSNPQIQCECNGQQANNNGQEQQTRPPFLPPQYSTTTTTPRIPFEQYTTTQRYYQTTTTTPPVITGTTRGAPPMYTTTPRPLGPPKPSSAPDALPCVMIQIRTGQKVCACQENYKQCTENVCCNIEKYSSLKANDDPHPSPSAGAATVDLLVDLLQKVRESLV